MDLFDGFYNGKRVLVTGHTGFRGSWLSVWLPDAEILSEADAVVYAAGAGTGWCPIR